MQCDRNFLSVVSVSQVFGVSKYKSENDRNWYFRTHKSFSKVNENNCETECYQKKLFFLNHQNFQIYSLFLIKLSKLLTEHTGKLTDFRLKLANFKAKTFSLGFIFGFPIQSDFRYPNRYKNITFFSNFKTREKIK